MSWFRNKKKKLNKLLIEAAKENNLPLISELMMRGARSVNEAFIEAVKHNNLGAVQLLFTYGAEDGSSFPIAISLGHYDVLAFLMNNVNEFINGNEEYKNNVLHDMLMYSRSFNRPHITNLISKTINPTGELDMSKLLVIVDPVNDNCPICYSSLDNDYIDDGEDYVGRPLMTECGHIFHEKCLQEWNKRSNDCPMCRQGNMFFGS